MSKGATTIAWRSCAAAFAVAIGCGVVAVAPDGLSIPTAAAMAGGSGPADPQGPGTGGALPVVPAHGGCIIGLNCGCIRGTTGPCTGPPLLKHPAIHNAPQGARDTPVEGHG